MKSLLLTLLLFTSFAFANDSYLNCEIEIYENGIVVEEKKQSTILEKVDHGYFGSFKFLSSNRRHQFDIDANIVRIQTEDHINIRVMQIDNLRKYQSVSISFNNEILMHTFDLEITSGYWGRCDIGSQAYNTKE